MSGLSRIVDFDPDSYKEDARCFPGIKMWAKNIISMTGLEVPFRVIEIGCGSGKFSAFFKHIGCDVLATDANSKMLDRVTENFSQFKLETRVVALPDVPDDIKDYDLAFNEGLIEHFPPDEAVEMIQAMASTLKPDGWVAIYMPVDTQDEGEYPYTPEEILEVFRRAGLTETNVWYNIWANTEGKQKRHLGCIGRKRMTENDWTMFQEEHYSKNVIRERNRTRETIAINLLKKHGVESGRVADVGCGEGGLTVELAKEGYDAIGMDLLEVMYECRNRYQEHQDLFMVFDAEKDLLPDVDVVIALELVEHLKNDFAFLEMCNRAAEHIIICIPESNDITPVNHHLRYYPRASMEKLLRVAGYKVLDYKVDTNSQFFYGCRK
jgi:2-polyprenyl-3-methyl-5-hydroxy-6-metoxy-1,4-benzoquinol methylase